MNIHQICVRVTNGLLRATLYGVLCIAFPGVAVFAGDDAKDWPMYNADLSARGTIAARRPSTRPTPAGSRRNGGSRPKDSDTEIGVIHATPVVVNGYVYFGTATDPTFYKLTPDGKVRWSYRNTRSDAEGQARGSRKGRAVAQPPVPVGRQRDHGLGARHRRHGLFRRHRRLDLRAGPRDRRRAVEAQLARAKDFPGAHPINVFFASPLARRRQADRGRRHARAGHRGFPVLPGPARAAAS